MPSLSEQLKLTVLWDTLSDCLTELQLTQDNHAVLVLQVVIENRILIHLESQLGSWEIQVHQGECWLIVVRVSLQKFLCCCYVFFPFLHNYGSSIHFCFAYIFLIRCCGVLFLHHIWLAREARRGVPYLYDITGNSTV